MLLTRTPYNASGRVSRFNSPRLLSVVPQMNDTAVAAGYIIVFQDVRGKFGSEGDYVMTRPLRGPLNPTEVDHATDCYDTIDWLVKNVPESQRPRRHHRRLVRGLHHCDVDGESASGVEGGRAVRADDRWLDGR